MSDPLPTPAEFSGRGVETKLGKIIVGSCKDGDGVHIYIESKCIPQDIAIVSIAESGNPYLLFTLSKEGETALSALLLEREPESCLVKIEDLSLLRRAAVNWCAANGDHKQALPVMEAVLRTGELYGRDEKADDADDAPNITK